MSRFPWKGFLGALMNATRRPAASRELESYAYKTLTAECEWCPHCALPSAEQYRYDIITEDGGLVVDFRWCDECQTLTQLD